MKLQQLRFLVAVAQNDLNITAAAAKLGATQPALSKQLKLLEEELGFSIFVRKGRAFTRITPAGDRVIGHALRLLREVRNIKGVSEEVGRRCQGGSPARAASILPRSHCRPAKCCWSWLHR
jgi:LysR family transcriptional regulator, cys regulon transcriptional activator